MKKLVFLILVASFSFAGFIDGNNLYQAGLEYYKNNIGERCNWFQNGFYEGYVDGVFDAYNGILICSPNNIKAGQVFDIVFKYLQNHPENRNLSANYLVLKALQEVWPCKNNNGSKK